MDSERRHELEQNSLSRFLVEKGPGLLREYGSYLLLGIVVIAVAVYLYRLRSQTALQERQAVANNLYAMIQTVSSAEQMRSMAPSLPQDLYEQERAALITDFNASAQIAADSEAVGVRAHALRLRGDFGWTMATLPPPSPAAPSTQPATQPSTLPSTQPAALSAASLNKTSDEWLEEAQAAYRQVVEKYPQQTSDVMAALFGLAAIAEQRGNFEQAGEYYDQILEREEIGEAIKQTARDRRQLLDFLVMNPRLARPETPATTPTNLTTPTTAPTTSPASDAERKSRAAELLTRPEDVNAPATRSTATPATAPTTQSSN